MSLVDKILGWLRAGYPQGIPQGDYIALLGVLHRELTEAEVEKLTKQLRDGEGGIPAEVSDERIREAIRRSVLEEPSEADVARVAARLAAGGWPLTAVEDLRED